MKYFFSFIGLLIIIACNKDYSITPNENSDILIQNFIQKEKFISDSSIYYPGIMSPELKPTYTSKINKIAQEFLHVVQNQEPKKSQYIDAIKKGLTSFENEPLDTEDKERVCLYIEELMDIVNLKSSEGLLKTFVYGKFLGFILSN